jgi:hypothetical protein
MTGFAEPGLPVPEDSGEITGSGGEFLATLSTAAVDDVAAVLCRHARPEAVAALPHEIARLKSAFRRHICVS